MIFSIWHFTVDVTQFVGQKVPLRFIWFISSVHDLRDGLYSHTGSEGMTADQFSLAPHHTVTRETLYTGATAEALNSKPKPFQKV